MNDGRYPLYKRGRMIFCKKNYLGVCVSFIFTKPMKRIHYNPILKQYARELRNNSTKSEIKLWKKLSGTQMLGYDFHRQKPVDNYILDFFCYDLMLGIELYGYTHQFEEVAAKDVVKENRLKELGITILRFNDDEVHNDMNRVIFAIEATIRFIEESVSF